MEYNAGTIAYRAGQFPQATQAFQQSIKIAPASDAKRLADQEDAYYNLGNALYRAGQQFEKSAPQEAIQKWTEAVKAYDTALQLRGDDADSKYNRDFVKRKIDALRQPPDQGGGGGGGGGQGQGGSKARVKGSRRGSLQPRDNLHRRAGSAAARVKVRVRVNPTAGSRSASGTAAAAGTTSLRGNHRSRRRAQWSPPPVSKPVRRHPSASRRKVRARRGK